MTRKFVAALIGLGVIAYIAAVISGRIDEHRRIDSVALLLLLVASAVVTVIGWPDVVKRLKVLEFSGFKLEMLGVVNRRQVEQESRLESIDLILPLLLPDSERQHLRNLASLPAQQYQGSHALRRELRHLRSVGLIRIRNDGHVGDLKDGFKFEIGQYVDLTVPGKRWVEQLERTDKLYTRADPEEEP